MPKTACEGALSCAPSVRQDQRNRTKGCDDQDEEEDPEEEDDHDDHDHDEQESPQRPLGDHQQKPRQEDQEQAVPGNSTVSSLQRKRMPMLSFPRSSPKPLPPPESA